MRVLARILAIVALTLTVSAVTSPASLACSAPFEKPSIRGLGPAPLIVLGTTGERVAGGRLFHVERAWNGVTTTPIVITFMEGEPVGDCSYPMTAGQHLIIAPDRVNGVLAANLVTLQADPASETGRRYLIDTESMFGAGVVPAAVTPDPALGVGQTGPAATESDLRPVLLGLVGGLALFGIVVVAARRSSRSRDES